MLEQIAALELQIEGLRALIMGARDQGKWYALIGSHIVFGCKITAPGLPGAGMILALNGQAENDTGHHNPDAAPSLARPEEYPNIANIYGEVFLSANRNLDTIDDDKLTIAPAPDPGWHRHDILYAYVSGNGPELSIAQGASTPTATPPADPALPHGTLALARVHVQGGITAITNADITDLRNFTGRLRGETGARGATVPPFQQRFIVGAGQSGTEFILNAAPLNGICLISIDGYTVHHYTVEGTTVQRSLDRRNPGRRGGWRQHGVHHRLCAGTGHGAASGDRRLPSAHPQQCNLGRRHPYLHLHYPPAAGRVGQCQLFQDRVNDDGRRQ